MKKETLQKIIDDIDEILRMNSEIVCERLENSYELTEKIVTYLENNNYLIHDEVNDDQYIDQLCDQLLEHMFNTTNTVTK